MRISSVEVMSTSAFTTKQGSEEIAPAMRSTDTFRRRVKMTERKFVRLGITTLVAIVVISAGNRAWAAGPCLNAGNTGLPAGECVNLYGYDVKVQRGTSGLFPDYVDGNSVYEWSISPVSTEIIKYDVDSIDISIPANIAEYSNLNSDGFINVHINGCDITYASAGSNRGTWLLYGAGAGDPSIPFGKFEYDQYVLKIIPGGTCQGITKSGGPYSLKVTFLGKRLFSGLEEFLIKPSPLQTGKKVTQPSPVAESLEILGPSLISGSTTLANQPPLRSVETFKLGDKNCVMEILLDQEGSIAKATMRPFEVGTNGCTEEDITISKESIGKAFICDKDGSGLPFNCKPKTFVEQNIMDKSGDDSTYCYYTKTGQRVCKTL